MTSTAGGAATNAGVDFQNRIGAYVLAHVLAGRNVLPALGLLEDWEITEVRFEGSQEIDDLDLISPSGRVLIQAKRTLHLSDQMDSDLSAVLGQFVRQYGRTAEREDLYIIATSSRSSKRITQELKKLTEALRLNESGSDENPLTKCETEVLQKTRALIEKHLNAAGLSSTRHDIDQVFRRIHVAVLHVDPGEAHERVANMVLASRGVIDTPRLWSMLLELCLTLSKDRLSIDVKGLNDRYGIHLSSSTEDKTDRTTRTLQLQLKGRLSTARDVLLLRKGEMPEFRVYQESEEYDYQVFEFFRFNDDGSRRLTFDGDRCQLSSGPSGVVLRRTATYEGMKRYLNESSDLADKRLCVMAANYASDPESQPAAKLHSEYLARQLETKSDLLQCLQCSDPISEQNAALIEIDENGMQGDVGLVHSRCLRPTHRILGGINSELFRTHALLRDFDFEGWATAAGNGQGLFSAVAPFASGLTPVYWVHDYHQLSRGGWCLRINLADGSARYATERGRVTRKSMEQATISATRMNEQIARQRESGDPQCYIDDPGSFVPYSVAIRQLGDSTKCIEVLDTQAARYTRSIARTYSVSEEFYAPLALLMSVETGDPIEIDGFVFLISNPFKLGPLFDNWKKAGCQLPEFTVSFLRSDDEFDKFVIRQHANGVTVLVDPLMNLSREVIKGFVIKDYYEVVAAGAAPVNELTEAPAENSDDETLDPPRALLIIKAESDGTFTHSYASNTLERHVIAVGCTSGTCRCLGCQIVELQCDDGTGRRVPVVDKARARSSAEGELILPIFVGDEIIAEMLNRSRPR